MTTASRGSPASTRYLRRGKGGEAAMVPRAEPRSYHGLPILNAPVWKPDIPAYFFLGGMAGASSVLAAGARRTNRRSLERATATTALAALGAGAVALVHDLGRPARFHHMLRVFKPSSPMSVGSWILVGYGPAVGVAAVHAATGRWRRLGGLGNAAAALLGPAVSTYTAALLSDTAVPAWRDAQRHLPAVFAGSSASAAGGMAMVLVPADEASPARRLAVMGALTDLVAATAMETGIGIAGEAYETGRAGRWLRWARRLTAIGATLALVGGRRRLPAAVAGGALVAGSAMTRFGVVEAGKQSVADPRYVVEGQRSR